jgi:hypothetical protein
LDIDGLIHLPSETGIFARMGAYQSARPWKRDVLQDDLGGLIVTALADQGEKGGDIDVGGAGRLAWCRLKGKTEPGGTSPLFDMGSKLLLPLFYEPEDGNANRRSRLPFQAFCQDAERFQVRDQALALSDLREQPEHSIQNLALRFLIPIQVGQEEFYGVSYGTAHGAHDLIFS